MTQMSEVTRSANTGQRRANEDGAMVVQEESSSLQTSAPTRVARVRAQWMLYKIGMDESNHPRDRVIALGKFLERVKDSVTSEGRESFRKLVGDLKGLAPGSKVIADDGVQRVAFEVGKAADLGLVEAPDRSPEPQDVVVDAEIVDPVVTDNNADPAQPTKATTVSDVSATQPNVYYRNPSDTSPPDPVETEGRGVENHEPDPELSSHPSRPSSPAEILASLPSGSPPRGQPTSSSLRSSAKRRSDAKPPRMPRGWRGPKLTWAQLDAVSGHAEEGCSHSRTEAQVRDGYCRACHCRRAWEALKEGGDE